MKFGDKEAEDLVYKIMNQKKILFYLLKEYLKSKDWNKRYEIVNLIITFYEETMCFNSQDLKKKRVFDKYPAVPVDFDSLELSYDEILQVMGITGIIVDIAEELKKYIKTDKSELSKEATKRFLINDVVMLFNNLTNKKYSDGFPMQPLQDFMDKLLEIK